MLPSSAPAAAQEQAARTVLSRAGHQSRRRAARVMWFVLALIIGISFAFPLYFMVSSSFKADPEVLTSPIHWWPQNFQGMDQFRKAFQAVALVRYFFNSTLMATLDVIVTVIFSALAGYGFAKFNFRGKRLLFLFVLSTIMIPFQVLVVPLFIEIHSMGWDDTYQGLIVPGIMNAFGVFMMRQFAYAIPDDLLDAARIDGASEPRIFWQVVFPLLGPAAASLATIIFLFSWNNFLWPLIVIKSDIYTTLPVGVSAFAQPPTNEPQWGMVMAISTLATMPVAVLFLFFQRYFIEGLILSGLKG